MLRCVREMNCNSTSLSCYKNAYNQQDVWCCHPKLDLALMISMLVPALVNQLSSFHCKLCISMITQGQGQMRRKQWLKVESLSSYQLSSTQFADKKQFWFLLEAMGIDSYLSPRQFLKVNLFLPQNRQHSDWYKCLVQRN